MLPQLRTRLVSLEPEQIALTVGGKARVRVRGNVCGFVRCGRQRRWVLGAFDETFQLVRADEAVVVSALGLGGFARRTLRFAGALDLTVMRPSFAIGRIRWSSYPSPRLEPLSARAIQQGLSEHEHK